MFVRRQQRSAHERRRGPSRRRQGRAKRSALLFREALSTVATVVSSYEKVAVLLKVRLPLARIFDTLSLKCDGIGNEYLAINE